ncbi:hypothetical protein ADUPG1_010637, partial [Aduncisulcus paluster]
MPSKNAVSTDWWSSNEEVDIRSSLKIRSFQQFMLFYLKWLDYNYHDASKQLAMCTTDASCVPESWPMKSFQKFNTLKKVHENIVEMIKIDEKRRISFNKKIAVYDHKQTGIPVPPRGGSIFSMESFMPEALFTPPRQCIPPPPGFDSSKIILRKLPSHFAFNFNKYGLRTNQLVVALHPHCPIDVDSGCELGFPDQAHRDSHLGRLNEQFFMCEIKNMFLYSDVLNKNKEKEVRNKIYNTKRPTRTRRKSTPRGKEVKEGILPVYKQDFALSPCQAALLAGCTPKTPSAIRYSTTIPLISQQESASNAGALIKPSIQTPRRPKKPKTTSKRKQHNK